MHGKKVLKKHDLQNENLQNLYCYKIFFLLLVLSAVESSEKKAKHSESNNVAYNLYFYNAIKKKFIWGQ